MSEPRPLYIDCASSSQAQTDLLIQACGGLVEINGHPIAHLTPQDARKAAKQIMAIADYLEPENGLYGQIDALPTLPDPADMLEGFADGLYRVKRLTNGWRISRVKE